VRCTAWIAISFILAACGRIDFAPLTTGDGAKMIDAHESDTGGSGMVTYVQDGGNARADGGAQLSTTLTGVRAGDALFLAIDWATNAGLATTTDTQGTSYAIAVGPNDAYARNYLLWGIAPADGNDTISISTDASTGVSFELRVIQIRGVAATGALDATAMSSGMTTSTEAATVSLTTTAANELMFVFEDGSTGPPTAGAGFSTVSTFDGDLSEIRTTGAPGAYIGSLLPPPGTTWSICAATFRTL